MAEPWDIPDPCHFEPCPPAPECGPCDAGSIFKQHSPLPGIPVGRKVVPLVRVNGQVQDLNAGGYIQNGYLEPPSLSWNPTHGILEVGGRYVKLTGVGDMMYSDCHGQVVSPCTPIMTCGNFAEIIGASTGVGFKTPQNPFAGLTVILRANSGLLLDNGGLGLDWNAVCAYVAANCGGGVTPTPTNTPTPTPTPTPTNTPTPTPTPTPTGTGTTSSTPPPTGTSGDQQRTGIPIYECRASDNSSVQTTNGTTSINWNAVSGQITIPVFGGSALYLYSGAPGATNLIGISSSSGYTLAQFNAITLIAKDVICGGTSSSSSSSSSTSSTSSSTPPAPSSKSVQMSNGTLCGLFPYTAVFDPGTGKVTIDVSGGIGGSGTTTGWQGYTSVNGGSPTGPIGATFSYESGTVISSSGWNQFQFDQLAALQGGDDCSGTGG